MPTPFTEKDIVDQTNAYRQSKGLPALNINPVLMKAAQDRAQEMAASENFSHSIATSTSKMSNAWGFMDRAGYKFLNAGENLAEGYNDATTTMQAWQKSPTHNENLVNPKYSEMGVAIVPQSKTGKLSNLVVHFFGTPAPQSIPTPIKATAPKVLAKPVTSAKKSVPAKASVKGASVGLDPAIQTKIDQAQRNVFQNIPGASERANDPYLNSLLSSGQNRDIPWNVPAAYIQGLITKDELGAAVGSTPTYDPTKGPQVNYGAGNVPFNGALTPPAAAPLTSSFSSGAATPLTYTVKAGDNLSKIAQQYGVSVNDITGYKSGNPNLIQPGEVLTLGRPASTPLTGGPVDVSKITPASPLGLTTPKAGLDLAGATVASATATSTSLQDIIAQLTPPVSADQGKADVLTQRINDLIGQEGGQAQALATEENNRGVATKTQALADVNAQILTKTAEYAALQADNQGKPITMNSIIGSERQILNAKAADIGLLQAQALGLQGQITAAEDAAKKAVDLRYAPILEELQIKQQQLALLQPKLNKEEKLYADALNMQYQDRKDTLAKKVADDKTYETYFLTALANGVPLAKVQQARALYAAGNGDAAVALIHAGIGTKSNDLTNPTGGTKTKPVFTQTQINNGAATAKIPIADFKTLDPDTQNFFINNSKDVEDRYKLINDAKTNGEDPAKIEAEISDSNAPNAVKDSLVRYLHQVFPASAFIQRKKFLGIF